MSNKSECQAQHITPESCFFSARPARCVTDNQAGLRISITNILWDLPIVTKKSAPDLQYIDEHPKSRLSHIITANR